MSDVHLEALPRMADFVLWATACETALWPAGTFARSYKANRRATVESIIEADPIANCVRAIMVDRTMWTGSASDLLHLWAESARDEFRGAQHGQKKPRALAGRLRRAQTQTCRAVIEDRGKAVPDCWVWSCGGGARLARLVPRAARSPEQA
jgi:hypothetical protein